MVIVVSFTAISNFVIPSLAIANSIRLIRFVMMFIAASLGLFGIMSFLMVLLIHMAGLRSFGVPYLSPVAPHDSALSEGHLHPCSAVEHEYASRKTNLGKETRRQAPNQKPQPVENAANPSPAQPKPQGEGPA